MLKINKYFLFLTNSLQSIQQTRTSLMEILKIQALRGPNIWSVQRKKLIQMRLDLQEMEQSPTNKIEGFRERIEAMFPTMIEHRCSEGVRGGFFSRYRGWRRDACQGVQHH